MARPVSSEEVQSYLDALLRVAEYDEGAPSNGLLVDSGQPITQLAAAVNTSFTSIRGASSLGAQLMLVHHTTWASIDRELKSKKEQALQENGISLYAAHAALDCHPEFSNATTLAAALGVQVEGRFVQYCGGLAGAYGTASGSFAAFVEKVRTTVNSRVDTWQNNESFSRVGIVPGGGPWTTYVEEARSLGCDTYLTGEVTMYTKLYARETRVNLIAATHYSTETFGIQALTQHVAAHFDLPWGFVPEDPDIQ